MVLILSGLQTWLAASAVERERKTRPGPASRHAGGLQQDGKPHISSTGLQRLPLPFQHHQRPTFNPRLSSPSPLHPSPAAASRSAFSGCLRDISTQTLFLTRPVCSHQTSLPLTPTAFTLSSQLHILCALPARSIHTLHYTAFTAVFPVF